MPKIRTVTMAMTVSDITEYAVNTFVIILTTK